MNLLYTGVWNFLFLQEKPLPLPFRNKRIHTQKCHIHMYMNTFTDTHIQPWLPVVTLILYTDCIDPYIVGERENTSCKYTQRNFCWLHIFLHSFQLWKGGKSADEAWRREKRRREIGASVISPMSSNFCIWYTYTHARTHTRIHSERYFPQLFWEGIR